MNGFFSRVARFAVSKMAAFCYAVAVGVAGNLIFHYVQTHEAVPSVAATHREAPPPEDKPPAIAPAAAIIAKPSAPLPAVPAKPVALPEPAAVNLPTPAAMSGNRWAKARIMSAHHSQSTVHTARQRSHSQYPRPSGGLSEMSLAPPAAFSRAWRIPCLMTSGCA